MTPTISRTEAPAIVTIHRKIGSASRPRRVAARSDPPGCLRSSLRSRRVTSLSGPAVDQLDLRERLLAQRVGERRVPELLRRGGAIVEVVLQPLLERVGLRRRVAL